ncbi:Uncharacterized protein Adt_05503 [Abeliophyllum distichum]|uniref:Uncharacterized protein n=1 Tax=Abeliophyllum distichum TaxID=126358 RepID=A0ABD1V496_9LAMI
MKLRDVLEKLDEQPARLELDNLSQINCDLTDAKISTTNDYSQADSERSFKYTFSRKPKMDSSIKLEEDSSFGESSLKMKSREREGRPSGLQNSILMNKSSSINSRRLLQVAHQVSKNYLHDYVLTIVVAQWTRYVS